jgi:hypothetical protein
MLYVKACLICCLLLERRVGEPRAPALRPALQLRQVGEAGRHLRQHRHQARLALQRRVQRRHLAAALRLLHQALLLAQRVHPVVEGGQAALYMREMLRGLTMPALVEHLDGAAQSEAVRLSGQNASLVGPVAADQRLQTRQSAVQFGQAVAVRPGSAAPGAAMQEKLEGTHRRVGRPGQLRNIPDLRGQLLEDRARAGQVGRGGGPIGGQLAGLQLVTQLGHLPVEAGQAALPGGLCEAVQLLGELGDLAAEAGEALGERLLGAAPHLQLAQPAQAGQVQRFRLLALHTLIILISHKRKVFLWFKGNFYVMYSTLFHLPPLRFHSVGGYRDRTQDGCDYDIDCQTL